MVHRADHPVVGLIVLLVINAKATLSLRRKGVRVGLMGANRGQMAALRRETAHRTVCRHPWGAEQRKIPGRLFSLPPRR